MTVRIKISSPPEPNVTSLKSTDVFFSFHAPGFDSGATALSVNWPSSPNNQPELVMGLRNGAVEYYTGAVDYSTEGSWRELHDNGWGSPVTQMSVQWASDSDDNEVR